MPYSDRLTNEHNLSLDRLIAISKNHLPDNLKTKPWNSLGHGVPVLQTDIQLDAYIAAYGFMHQGKCRAAFQNFPFKKLPFNVEIVDWGCGQGIATLALLDTLRDRDMLDRIKRITLIEPSTAAIKRAECNIRNSLYGRDIKIQLCNKYLPSIEGSHNEVSSVELIFNSASTIHLFSNVLDIVSIDLRKTASLLMPSIGQHYVVCISPHNRNSGRVDEFCKLLNATDFFSNITNACYAKTPDTNYGYSCVTRGFVIDIEKGKELNSTVMLNEYDADGTYDDYDRRALARNGELSDGFINVYEGFASQLTQNDKIFIRPSIESDTYDLFIIKQRYGALIVKIYEENIDGKILTSEGVCDDNNMFEKVSPISTVLDYKETLSKLYSRKLIKDNIQSDEAFYEVKTVVCFPFITEGRAKAFCSQYTQQLTPSKRKCVSILGSDSFHSGNIWAKVGFQYPSKLFTQANADELTKLASSQWHSYKDGNRRIKLIGKQKVLAQSIQGKKQKIRGVAGSGKTQILVSRAINAQLRTGGKVLILTYNISLANYIRFRMAQIPADFLWDNFTIGTYLRFFTSQANNTNCKINDLLSYSNESFFDKVSEQLPKYDAILVDEVQDYKTSWLRILQRFFLKDVGEFVTFGDEKQNIYDRPLDEERKVTIPGISGEWNTLTKCFRTCNNRLIDLSIDFQREFMPLLNPDDVERELLMDDSFFHYEHIDEIRGEYDTTSYDEMIFSTCMNAIQKIGGDINNSVVLAPTCSIIRIIDYYCRKQGICTTTMCETKELYDSLEEKYGNNESLFSYKINEIRENKKHHFSMTSEGLKISTVHSYKGWEAETVILYIPKKNTPHHDVVIVNDEQIDIYSPQIIYTAITRAIKNLIIINLGNPRYDSFFRHR